MGLVAMFFMGFGATAVYFVLCLPLNGVALHPFSPVYTPSTLYQDGFPAMMFY